MSIDISLVVEKTQESADSENEEVDIDRNKFFSPGILFFVNFLKLSLL